MFNVRKSQKNYIIFSSIQTCLKNKKDITIGCERFFHLQIVNWFKLDYWTGVIINQTLFNTRFAVLTKPSRIEKTNSCKIKAGIFRSWLKCISNYGSLTMGKSGMDLSFIFSEIIYDTRNHDVFLERTIYYVLINPILRSK